MDARKRVDVVLEEISNILKTFKDIEAKLELGKNTPAVISKVLSIELFSTQINNSKDFNAESIEQLKAGNADRRNIVLGKNFLLNITKKVIAKLNQLISGAPLSNETEDDKQILSFINKFTQATSERAAKDAKQDNQSNEEDKLDLAKAGQFYCSYFSKSALKLMQEQENRNAIAKAVVCLYDGKEMKIFPGQVKGTIAYEERGSKGWGFDPIFIPQGETKTISELGYEWKNKNSHRYKSHSGLKKYLME